MSHVALARKYRPKRFADLVAQEHVAAGLTGAMAQGRVAHGYLLTGPRGVGKTTAARILAMALNCEQRVDGAGEPCGTCDSCRRIWSGAANLDVVEIDAASNRGVDDARDLRERAMYAASAPGRHKIYIVDEAHMLTREAWNALLKILEEPPPGVVFVFATTEPQKIANTAAPVMSRLQRYDFRRIGPHAIGERLRHVAAEESITIDDDALLLVAGVANGGLRDALSLLDQALAFGQGAVTAARVRDALGLISDEVYGELLDLVADRRTADVFPYVGRLVDAGADLVEFANGLGEMLRALLLKIVGGEPEGITETMRLAVERHAESYTQGDLLRMLKLLAEAEEAIRRSPNARLHVETLLLHWTLLDRTVELAEVLEAVGRGSGGGVRGAGSGARDSSVRNPNPVSRVPRPRPRTPAPEPGSPLASLRAAWSQIVEAVGQRRRMVREALAHAEPIGFDGSRVTLAVTQSEVHLEGLERGREVIAQAIGDACGVENVRLVYQGEAEPPDTGAVAPAPSPSPAKRLDQEGDKRERLQAYRQKDPALDAVADSLDLEVLE